MPTDNAQNSTDNTQSTNGGLIVKPLTEKASESKVRTTTDPMLDLDNDNLLFYFPQYGVEEYINDRTIWQKQLYTIGGEQGWFYFKVFFNFNTNYGLLAGLLTDDQQSVVDASQSAIKFLATIDNRYTQEQIPHRMLSLYKFGSTLKSIQTETPWVIKGINGLDQIGNVNSEEFGKLKSIELVMNNETTDMRIGTLMDLYKYACFDSINCKEIIPANLRKFEMTVLCFHVPIKGYQTRIYSNATVGKTEVTTTAKNGTVTTKTQNVKGGTIDAKTTFLRSRAKEDFSNMLSFKMFSFKNCEFSKETLSGAVSGSLSNETAFNLGGQNVKITYERVLEHRMNEWGEFFMGDTGFLYNEVAPTAYIGDGKLFKDATESYKINSADGQNTQHKRYSFLANKRTLYEFTDGVIRDANIDATSWGDLNAFSVGRMGKDNLGTRHNSPYLNAKLKALKEGTLGKNVPTTALGSFISGGINLLSDFINGITKKNNPEGAKHKTIQEKVKEMKDGKTSFGSSTDTEVNRQLSEYNRSGWHLSPNKPLTIDEKIKKMNDGRVEFSPAIQHEIDEYEAGWTLAPDFHKTRDMVPGPKVNGRTRGMVWGNTPNFNDRLNAMTDGVVQFSPDIERDVVSVQDSRWKTVTPKTMEQKIADMKDGKVEFSPEIERDVVSVQDSRWTTTVPKTMDQKIAEMNDGKVAFSSDVQRDVVSVQDSRWTTTAPKTMDQKIADMNDGEVAFSPVIGTTQLADNQRGRSGGNLHNIQEKLINLRNGTIPNNTIKKQ